MDHVDLGFDRSGERQMRLPRPDGWAPPHRLWLRFESVATRLRATVNGVDVGEHVGDYVPFQLEITDAAGGDGDIDVAIDVGDAGGENGHITKGFHDVISRAHRGVWQPCSLRRTGPIAVVPDGVQIRADAATGAVAVAADLEPRPARAPGEMRVVVRDPDDAPVAAARTGIEPTRDRVDLAVCISAPRRWWPHDPALYTAAVELVADGEVSERHELRFGFRTVRADGRTIRLNGRPLLIRGMLDWGHEPETIAPAPSADQVRARFARLRAHGFNCVCLCMWYAPRHFYDIADETGMLLWQIHPVWQSAMSDDHLAEYKRLYRSFIRRDRRHPSVVVVSATCEHPSFHPRLARWWWAHARRRLPATLLQVQTSSFAWNDDAHTDLHDEHTYDNCNRWVTYLADVDDHLRTLPDKPFVMGETCAFSSWPDLEALRRVARDARPWWLPRAFDHMCELESAWRERYGDDVVTRLREDGDRHHLLGRKFQMERFRDRAGFAGLVMNHLRDVPQVQCGFMDDLGRWRFEPDTTAGWLADRAVLLWTPDHRRGFVGGRDLPCRVAVSNYGAEPYHGPIQVDIDGSLRRSARVSVDPGRVESSPVTLSLPATDRPRRVPVIARGAGLTSNAWDLWAMPTAASLPEGVRRMTGLPFADADAEPDRVECGYSRGFGLAVKRWRCRLPDPTWLCPDAPPWNGCGAVPDDTRVLLTHRLTPVIVDWLAGGGRVVLTASKAEGGLGTAYEWLFGQVPMILERGPLVEGDRAWLVDLLPYDLTRRYARVMPVEDLGVADDVDPLIRLAYTHDQERVRLLDQLFMTNVGAGLLLVTSLDHADDPGRYLLHRLIAYAAGNGARAERSLAPERLRGFAVQPSS